jgi:hypothetical protein
MTRLTVMIVMLSGCSFIGTIGPPEVGTPRATTTCASTAAPLIDSVFGAGLIGLGTASAIWDARHSSGEYRNLNDSLTAALFVPGLIYAASAIYGWVRVSNCGDAH